MKEYTVSLTAKGQFTLPREARAAMGVNPGDRLELSVTREGETVLRALNKPASAIFGRGKRFVAGAEGRDRMEDIADAIVGEDSFRDENRTRRRPRKRA